MVFYPAVLTDLGLEFTQYCKEDEESCYSGVSDSEYGFPPAPEKQIEAEFGDGVLARKDEDGVRIIPNFAITATSVPIIGLVISPYDFGVGPIIGKMKVSEGDPADLKSLVKIDWRVIRIPTFNGSPDIYICLITPEPYN